MHGWLHLCGIDDQEELDPENAQSRVSVTTLGIDVVHISIWKISELVNLFELNISRD